MKKYLEVVSYFLLITGLVFSGIFYMRFRYDWRLQLSAVLIATVYYLLWGFGHHYIRRDLTKRLVSEYLLLAGICALVGILVFAL